MSSQRLIDSSRAAGAKSHGPVTPDGRGESEEQFNALRDYQPQTRSQLDLVDQLVATRWPRQKPEIDEELESCGGALESLNRQETRLRAELRRPLKLLDARLKNQKLHDEPSSAKPPHSDEDRPAGEAPRIPSTIGQRPSTIPGRPAQKSKIA